MPPLHQQGNQGSLKEQRLVYDRESCSWVCWVHASSRHSREELCARLTGGREHGGREARAELGCRRVGKSVCVCVCAHTSCFVFALPERWGLAKALCGWVSHARLGAAPALPAPPNNAGAPLQPWPRAANRHCLTGTPAAPRSLMQAEDTVPPLQRGLQWCCSRAGSAPAPRTRGTAGRACLASQPKSLKVQRGRGEVGAAAREDAVSAVQRAQGTTLPAEPRPPGAAASLAPQSRHEQQLHRAHRLISAATLVNQTSLGCCCISCHNKGWH